MRDAGYEPQVEDVSGLSLVFAREGSIKRRLSVLEAAKAAEDPNAVLTPNVLLRAIVEQAVLPTIGYLGGPGELAYFAQATAAADAMGVNRPLALPRWSCTLIEPHIQRLLDAFGITPDALARPDALEGIVARAAMDGQSSETLRALRECIETMPEALAPESDPLGLSAAVQGAMQSLQHRVDRLERRLVAGIKRREHDAAARRCDTSCSALSTQHQARARRQPDANPQPSRRHAARGDARCGIGARGRPD